jgi:L-serine dehydratase
MFKSLLEIVLKAESQDIPVHEVLLREEMDQSGEAREVLIKRMRYRLEVMRQSAMQGLEQPIRTLSGMTEGNAHRMWTWIQNGAKPTCGSVLSRALARAIAIGEVNAGMGRIVAAPTAGASGILPAVLITLQEMLAVNDDQVINALFTAGGVGTVIVHRASISGAAGGCQAETGSAAAMAAAAAVDLLGGSARQSMHAVAITLQNMLGLVCDPVAGLVEVPCIKRNAGGVAQCFVAVDLVMAGIESTIPADEVIDAMREVGQRMAPSLRETAQGGLAHTPTGKALAKKIWEKTEN